MKCKKCGSEDVKIDSSTYTVSKSRSFLWNLLLVICTGGLWILWMLIRKKKEKLVTEKRAVCQKCGHSWKV